MKYSCPGLILLMFFLSTFSSYSQDNHPEHEHTVRDAGHTWHIGLGLSAAKWPENRGWSREFMFTCSGNWETKATGAWAWDTKD